MGNADKAVLVFVVGALFHAAKLAQDPGASPVSSLADAERFMQAAEAQLPGIAEKLQG